MSYTPVSAGMGAVLLLATEFPPWFSIGVPAYAFRRGTTSSTSSPPSVQITVNRHANFLSAPRSRAATGGSLIVHPGQRGHLLEIQQTL